MLLGAMAELRVGRPDRLATDDGPVIPAEAQASIRRHIAHMRERASKVQQLAGRALHSLDGGTYVLPTLIELESVAELEREVFGPVLHFVRYRREDLDGLVAQINATGYGLTLGLHTRIDETMERVLASAHAGNVYVNRNMVGAVVGVQPFGGEGLSGTGPKAGGPLYLHRLLSAQPAGVARDLLQQVRTLPGPTGERNTYRLAPRSAVLCLAASRADLLTQLDAVRAVGSHAIWPAAALPLLQSLPADAQYGVSLAQDWRRPEVAFEAVLLHGSREELAQVQRELAIRPGAIVPVERMDPGNRDVPPERLVVERSLSVNTAAAGGNASLMAIG